MHRYAWGPRFRVPGLSVLDRKAQLCRVIARGAMNSALVEFEDGERGDNGLVGEYRRVKPAGDSTI